MNDEKLRQRLHDLRRIAAELNTHSGHGEQARARIEGYRDGLRFAISFIEDTWPDEAAADPDVPLPRHE